MILNIDNTYLYGVRLVEEFRPSPFRFNGIGDSGVFELWFCRTLAVEADLIKNRPGVFGNSDFVRFGGGHVGAGEPVGIRALLNDLLNALATGVDSTEAIEATFESVFFLLGSADPFSVMFRAIVSFIDSSTPFFLFLLRCNDFSLKIRDYEMIYD